MSKILCLTGMHRSGTSLTASWIQKCGLSIDDGLTVEAYTGNDKGHFEDKEFVELHSEAILSHKRNSQGWRIYTPNYLDFTEAQVLKAKQLIQNRQKYSLWGWKDPRTTFFLPQWKTLLPELKTLLVWRPFSEVVDSLTRRSKKAKHDIYKIGLIGATRLWLSENELAYKYKKQYPDDTLLLPLKSIIDQDERAIQMIKEKLDIPLNYTPISEVYDSSSLNTKPKNNFNLVRKIVSSIDLLEQKLMEMSDLGYSGI